MDEKLRQAIVDFQNGNKDAFTTIYTLQYNLVFYIALQHTRNKEDAEDIAHNVFISIYRSLKQLDKPENFNAWMNRIVYHKFIKTIRSKQVKMRVEMENEDFEMQIPNQSGLSPKEKYHYQEVVEDVNLVFDELSLELQEVARLTFFDELTNQEIADILEIPVGTVKSRIHRIRKFAKERLKAKDYKMNVDLSVLFGLLFLMRINNVSSVDKSHIAGVALAAKAMDSKFGEIKVKKKLPKFAVAAGAITTIPLLVVSQTAIKLDSINYNDNWTNTYVDVQIKVDDSEIDHSRFKVELSGNPLPFIYSDGTYTVKVYTNGELNILLDDKLESSTQIGNIDKEPVEVTHDTDEEYINVLMSDQLSGVNWESITVYDHHGVSIDYDITEELMKFKYDKGLNYIIKGEDLAGNRFISTLDYVIE